MDMEVKKTTTPRNAEWPWLEATDYGNANTNTLFPRLASIWLLPPAATATYCLPPAIYDTAGALTPAAPPAQFTVPAPPAPRPLTPPKPVVNEAEVLSGYGQILSRIIGKC